MSRGYSRPIVVAATGVGAAYIPVDRYPEDMTVTVDANGNTFTVDYTQENIIRGPASSYDVNSQDLTTPAAAIWHELIASGAIDVAFRGKIQAYALRLDVTAVAQVDISAAIAEDGGVFTDETTEANEATANDVTLLPAVPVAGVDRFNFGFATKVPSFDLNVSTAGTGTYTLVWEYWNGKSWATLPGISDGTGDFKITTENPVSWTVPSDWALSNINGQGPFYFVRAEVQTGTVTIVPIGQQAFESPASVIRIAQAA